PDKPAGEASRNLRLLRFSPEEGEVTAEYAYRARPRPPGPAARSEPNTRHRARRSAAPDSSAGPVPTSRAPWRTTSPRGRSRPRPRLSADTAGERGAAENTRSTPPDRRAAQTS
ncbi:hypothetical protein ABZ714_27270, partial [Streptomyces sp. NPDC006798]|uniref:hypothetical protein n=1 Tax=Streptomyces sp. NPDC006798 TaxID=3155462 RepID=UPI0033C0DD14